MVRRRYDEAWRPSGVRGCLAFESHSHVAFTLLPCALIFSGSCGRKRGLPSLAMP